MPKVVKAYPITIGYRDTEAGERKLDELSERTGRSRAEVLRLLVQLAQPTDLPAVRFVPQTGGAPT
jgi:predicted DNA-binding protein